MTRRYWNYRFLEIPPHRYRRERPRARVQPESRLFTQQTRQLR